jgi:hypothetical protein
MSQTTIRPAFFVLICCKLLRWQAFVQPSQPEYGAMVSSSMTASKADKPVMVVQDHETTPTHALKRPQCRQHHLHASSDGFVNIRRAQKKLDDAGSLLEVCTLLLQV